jgi:two-component sensor histidine kinase
MHAAIDTPGNRKRQVSRTATCNADDDLRNLPTVTPELAAQKLLVESQIKLISQLEDRDAERTHQFEMTAKDLQRKNEDIVNLLSVILIQRREKEVILREVYHRVKNNLQVVESLMKMKSRSLADTTARGAFDTSIQRIRVMGMVHEHLYQTPDLGGVSLVAYLRGLIDGAIAGHPREAGEVKFELDVEEVPLTLDAAIPFGLLMNELLSNCFEHGLPKESAGEIHVSVHRSATGVRMIVKDNGIGLPEGFDPARTKTMGLKLARGLALQLGGTLKFASNHGCQVQAEFTRLAAQVKEESRGTGQRTATGTHPPHSLQSQA